MRVLGKHILMKFIEAQNEGLVFLAGMVLVTYFRVTRQWES